MPRPIPPAGITSIGVTMLVAVATLAGLVVAADAARAQEVDCGEYRGLVCEGLFTDEPDLVEDPDRVAEAIGRVTAAHGNPFAVAIAADARGEEPATFAADVANAWGVGDPIEENGIFVLIAIEERRTEVVSQDGIEVPGRAIANAGRSFFSAGDFEGGVLAIVGAVDQVLSGSTVTGGSESRTATAPGWIGVVLLGGAAAALGTGLVVSRRRQRARRTATRRERRVDRVLDLLEPRGDELALTARFSSPVPADATAATGPAIQTLFDIAADRAGSAPTETVQALARVGALTIVDVDAMTEATRVPLELRAGDERMILETGLEGALARIEEVPVRDDAAFDVALDRLQEVVEALRPHRVAAARRRVADAVMDRLTATPAGQVTVEHLGARLMGSAPVLDADAPIEESTVIVEAADRIAAAKVARVDSIRTRLATSRTRDVAAVALADADEDTDASVRRFTTVLTELRRHETTFRQDGISLAAVAALLSINNSDHDIAEFVRGYRRLRTTQDPAIALEGAVAGLFTASELSAVQALSEDLGVPIAIVVAIRERRDDGIDVYRRLLDDVDDVAGVDDAPVIAGILTVSLEAPIAFERWKSARRALGSLGLSGSYADVAAAFGASDPRGPRAFALAYAAQRTALEEAGFGDLTQYAPELAHAGTSDRRDSWTGRPLSTRRSDFDPYTFFYLHWAATRTTGGSSSWGGLYRSESWASGGSGQWWGGGTGFGSAGGSSWGSSWGSGGFSGGGFGGFGGGGGFSGGGGGGW